MRPSFQITNFLAATFILKETLLELDSSSLGKNTGVWEAAGIGSGKEGEHQAHASGAQEAGRTVQLASQHQEMLVEGKSDLGLSFYINQFFAYTDSWKISPLNLFSDCDTGNNNLVQQSN